MNLWNVPWLELAIVVPLVGALVVSRLRQPLRAFRWGLAFTSAAFACSLLTWATFSLRGVAGELDSAAWSLQPYLFGRQVFVVDQLSAPLIAAVALLHFLTALATARTKMRRFSFAWSLTSEAIRMATFGCKDEHWLLIALLAAGTLPAYLELVNRRKPTRVYLLHMALFVGLMTLGWAFVERNAGHQSQSAWATVPLMAAILVRCGTFPAHCWITDWFEHASFGNALLFVTPMTGVYAAVRLVIPVAPDWILKGIGIMSLITAVYAAGMATVQRDARRFLAYLFVSNASLVLVGLELANAISLTGSLCLWFSIILAIGGLGLTLRALEARFGRLSLTEFHGLYEHSPALAVCFAVTGLASVGFPGTLGYVSADLLVDGAIEVNVWIGLAVVAASALNGIAIVRAYLLLFTGTRHVSSVSLNIGTRERFAVLTLATLLIVGGLFPQWNVASRNEAAEAIVHERQKNAPGETTVQVGESATR